MVTPGVPEETQAELDLPVDYDVDQQYFRAMYEKMTKQYPLRKTGVRQLAVPRL